MGKAKKSKMWMIIILTLLILIVGIAGFIIIKDMGECQGVDSSKYTHCDGSNCDIIVVSDKLKFDKCMYSDLGMKQNGLTDNEALAYWVNDINSVWKIPAFIDIIQAIYPEIGDKTLTEYAFCENDEVTLRTAGIEYTEIHKICYFDATGLKDDYEYSERREYR